MFPWSLDLGALGVSSAPRPRVRKSKPKTLNPKLFIPSTTPSRILKIAPPSAVSLKRRHPALARLLRAEHPASVRFYRTFVVVLVASLGCSGVLHAQPHNPTPAQVAQLRRQEQAARAAAPHALSVAAALAVNIQSREAVRLFYLAICVRDETTPLGWTGRYSTGDGGSTSVAGSTSSAFKEAVILRINAMRALAGVPATVTLLDTYSAKDQQAALMMSVNDQLNHSPPSTWICYTADGALAAGNSNLDLADNGPHAISNGYIADFGDPNGAVGHRRWILYPQTQTMGTGDVPSLGVNYAANATWVIDSHFYDPRPPTRTPYVAWPAEGYMPAPLIYPRWSYSYPGADFSHATVTMTRDGAPVAVQLEAVDNDYGENTLVWVYGGLDASKVTPLTITTDSVFHVLISNIVINGTAQSCAYDVIAFDPMQPGTDSYPATVSGSISPVVGSTGTYSLTQPLTADTMQWRTLQFDSNLTTYDAENGLDGLIPVTTGSYSVRTLASGDVGAGTAGYQLALEGFINQFLYLPDTFYAPVGSTPQITFLSRLGYATSDQFARVQVSVDEGASWSDLFTEAGNGGPPETSFVSRTLALSSLAGRTFQIRFAYTSDSGSAYIATDAGYGWFVDNIALNGVQRVASSSAVISIQANTFDFTPSAAGTVGLQARGELFGTYPMAWGPVLLVYPTGAGTPRSTFANISARAYCGTGNNVTIGGFVIAGGTSKRVLVRAVGPSLTAQGIAAGEVLPDPAIEVHDALHNNIVIAANDNWVTNANASDITTVTGQVGAQPFLSTDTKSSALLVTLAPGVYSFVTTDKSSASGVVLIEVYDADLGTGSSTFANISARAYCTTGNNVTIGGFVIAGPRAKQILLRAVGPSLTIQDIKPTEVLLDPSIELHDALHDNAVIATNDNWHDAVNAAAILGAGARLGAMPFDSADTKSSAILLTLQPGVYSFVARGTNNSSGIVLVEVYDAD